MDEEVLVAPTSAFEALGTFLGFSDRVADYLPTLFRPENLRYLSRSQAEQDPSFKQLVPYAVLKHGESIYCYQRGGAGTERRLHDLWSLGVGGHICKADGAEGPLAYERGFARELDEEVEIVGPYESRIVGMVHDDRTPVGSVHLGIIHLLELSAPTVRPRDPALAQAGFRSFDDIRQTRDAFESWSTFVIDALFE